ncbi:hypothetical protein MGYG_05202 [Nannizzia gypsea CBS 118893]|uniref:Uncharacterized protein n=1 Tax=Arthroderma gypseum (strain ATCC MYA-4604 / CBS 118893) TaxID=535722 RepID=E4UV72_ARTGP|nr:hypothetical protein MGYG_05202 [Nannizzia gypsea CBS 118893]EFR02199.1 hypothetical protein MGYG_05202 [Nannizzia gypsea CBS 118893]
MNDRFTPLTFKPRMKEKTNPQWLTDGMRTPNTRWQCNTDGKTHTHKKKFWTKIGGFLDFPWREVEAMHFELGKEDLSSRANEASRNPTTSDRIMDVAKEIEYLRSIFYYDMDEPHEPLTYPRLLDALGGISICTTALIKQIETSPGPWSPRVIGLMEEMVLDLWILVSDELANVDWNPIWGRGETCILHIGNE